MRTYEHNIQAYLIGKFDRVELLAGSVVSPVERASPQHVEPSNPASARSPVAPQWKMGDKVTLRGTITKVDHQDGLFPYRVSFDEDTRHGIWFPETHLRPDVMPPAPPSDTGRISQRPAIPVGDWVSGREHRAIKAELADALYIITNRPNGAPPPLSGEWVNRKEHDPLKAELLALQCALDISGTDPVHHQMAVTDLRGALTASAERLADKELELGSLTREVTRLRKELREAKDKLARRGRL